MEFSEVDKVYGKRDAPDGLWRFIIEVQLREIKLAEATRAKANEWADIIFVAVHAIESLGFDPEGIAFDRLKAVEAKVHSGHLDKYSLAYKIVQGELCQRQRCGRILNSTEEVKYGVCSNCLNTAVNGVAK